MPTILTGLQNRVKNSAAYAEELGLMLISNGEELPYLLASTGEIITAGISSPVGTPVVTDTGAGNITNNKWAIYKVVYAGENSFPLVGARILSNPSDLVLYQFTGTGNRKVSVSIPSSTNTAVTHVYLYRTPLADSFALATISSDAGLFNYVDKVANNITGANVAVEDNNLSVIGNEPIELINFTVPQFKFSVWDGNYFWGFANHPFRAKATWQLNGEITLDNPDVDKFYGGRDNQFITFDDLRTGGIDGRGAFLFKQTGDYTGQAIGENGDNLTLASAKSGYIVIIGESATLYRSGYHNPFQWGYLQNIAGEYIPSLWKYKVSGSLGTAIAILPDQQLLKVDMEFPALCLTFSLQASGTDVFAQTKRQVSRLYSVTSHFSQFYAISKGRQVLWGFDFKNLAIIECDGYTQVPISGPISTLLRNLSKNRSLHLLAHGLYDPTTEINAMWLSSSSVDAPDSATNFDLCVYQHVPTGFWGIFADYGILCSAVIEDPVTSKRNTLVGTDGGFLGIAFDPSTYGNWIPNDCLYSGYINSATEATITRSEGQDDFNPDAAGLIGNFCVIVNSQGLQTQVKRIISATSDSLTFDTNLDPLPVTTDDTGLADGQSEFFIGLIELRMLKYFDGGEPSIDKTPREYWATLEDAKNPRIEFYAEHADEPTISLELNRDQALDAWYQKFDLPTRKQKSYGIALVERSYEPTKFYNFTIK